MAEKDKSNLIDSGTQAKIMSDTLENLVANLNTSRDKTTYGNFVSGVDLSHDRVSCDIIYRFEWPAKIIDIPPYDMTRQWRTWQSKELDDDRLKAIYAEEKRLEYKCNIQEALTWGGLYGGCVIVISVDGHGDISTPLDVSKITKGQLKGFHVIDKWRVVPQQTSIITDPFSVFQGDPELYMVNETGQRIHRSRLVKFIGGKLPYWDKRRYLWWGDSVLNRFYSAMRNAETINSSIASLVHETNIDVFSINGLAEYLATDGQEEIKKRFELMALMKSINNMMLIDGETETYERKGMDFKALPQLSQQFLTILSAASNIPATRFLGKSPDGMNATGESDLTIYYDMISGKQQTDLEPQMNYLDEVMIRSLFGDYPEELSWSYNPLWQISEKDQSAINLETSTTLLNLQMLGVPDEALLKDVQAMGLSNNLTDEMIELAISDIEEDIDEDEDAISELEEQNGIPNEPDKTTE